MEIDEGNGAPKLSAEADRELTRLWRTWRTVLEMLVDRVRAGHSLPSYSILINYS